MKSVLRCGCLLFCAVVKLSHAGEASSDTLFKAVLDGDLARVELHLEQGVDLSITQEGQTALEAAKAKCPAAPWSKNEYTHIASAIAQGEIGQAEQRREDLLNSATPSDILLYAVEEAPSCNLTMAQIAIEREGSIVFKKFTRAGTDFTAQNLAAQRAADYWTTNDCSSIVVALERKAEALTKDAVAMDDASNPAIMKLQATFANFVGLEHLLEKFITRIKRHEFQMQLNPDMKCSHEAWIITGTPGTGKTSIAREITPILREANIIQGTRLAALSDGRPNDFKELDKNDLKGTHVGQTEEKLTQMFDDYAGGVLFFDEAYTYTTKDEYEKAILEGLLRQKTVETTCEDRMLFIFAGYPNEMEEWKNFNSGWRGRVDFEFEIPDLNAEVLAKITVKKLFDQYASTMNVDPISYEAALTQMIDDGFPEKQRNSKQLKLGARLSMQLVHHILTHHQKWYFEKESVHGAQSDIHMVEQETVCNALNTLAETHMKNPTTVKCAPVPKLLGGGSVGELDATGKAPTHSQSTKSKVRPQQQRPPTAPRVQRLKTKTESKAAIEVNTWLRQLWGVIYSTLRQIVTFINSLPLAYQVLIYLAIGIFVWSICGNSVMQFMKVTWYVFKIVWWIIKKIWSLFKFFWNSIMDLLGSNHKFKDNVAEDHPFTDPFIRARNIVAQGARQAKGSKAVDEVLGHPDPRRKESVAKAMQSLWEAVPKDIAINGSNIKANLEMYWESEQESAA